MVIYHRQINADESLAIAYATPAYARKTGDTVLSDVVQNASAAEDPRGWDTILRGSKTLVKPIP
jgi:hypothetical protein